MQHGGALAARAGVLDVYATEAVGRHIGGEVNDVGQVGAGGARGGRLDVCTQLFPDEIEENGASRAVTCAADGSRERRDGAVVVTHQEEIDRLGMLRGTYNAQTVARERLGIEFQADIHILTGGRAEALTGGLRGIDIERQRHVGVLSVYRRVHDARAPLGL